MTFLSTLTWVDLLLLLASVLSAALYGASFFKQPFGERTRIAVRSLRAAALFLFVYFGTRFVFFAVVVGRFHLQDTTFPSSLFVLLAVYLFGLRFGAAVLATALLLVGYYAYLPGYSLGFIVSSALSSLLSGTAALVLGEVLTRYRNTLSELNAQLRALVRARERVSYMLAHDMRNSLAILRLQSDLLDLPAADSSAVRATIASEAGKAVQVLESVLYLAKVSSPGALQKETFDLGALCEEERASMVTLHADHVFVYVHEGEAVQVFANREAVRRIVANLLSNAVKYAPSGTTVRLTTASTESSWQLQVRDEGIGMDASHVERLFEPLTQGDAASPGIGLGLHIVKMLVELHGGSIAVDSVLGKGTTFTIIFPARPRASAPGRRPRPGVNKK